MVLGRLASATRALGKKAISEPRSGVGVIADVFGRALGAVDQLGTKFYADGLNCSESGWGELETVDALTRRMLHPPADVWTSGELDVEVTWNDGEWEVVYGGQDAEDTVYAAGFSFASPGWSPELAAAVPMLAASERAMARVVTDDPGAFLAGKQAVLVGAPPSGIEGFSRPTTAVGIPLAHKHGVATVMIEAPMYGRRRAAHRKTGNAARFEGAADLMAQAAVIAHEQRAMLEWLRNDIGASNLVVGGLSYGGLMSSIVATTLPYETGLVVGFAPVSPERVFADPATVMGRTVDYAKLGADDGTDAETARAKLAAYLREDASLAVRPLPIATQVPGRIEALSAVHDGFVLPDMSIALHEHLMLPESAITWCVGGHASSFILHTREFCRAVARVAAAHVPPSTRL